MWLIDAVESNNSIKSIDSYFGLRNDVQVQFFIDDGRAGLAQVALIRHQTASAEAARTAQFVQPFRPFRIESAVRFFIFRLENSNYHLANGEDKKISTRRKADVFEKDLHKKKF